MASWECSPVRGAKDTGYRMNYGFPSTITPYRFATIEPSARANQSHFLLGASTLKFRAHRSMSQKRSDWFAYL